MVLIHFGIKILVAFEKIFQLFWFVYFALKYILPTSDGIQED